MRNGPCAQACPLLKLHIEVDVEVAPANPREQEGRLTNFDDAWLKRRVQVVSHSLDELGGLIRLRVQSDEHGPSVTVLGLGVAIGRLWVLNEFVRVAKDEFDLLFVPYPGAFFDQLLLSFLPFGSSLLFDLLLHFLVHERNEQFIEVSAAQRACHSHVDNRSRALKTEGVLARGEYWLSHELQTNRTFVLFLLSRGCLRACRCRCGRLLCGRLWSLFS
jgi:hypothetical protein